MPGVHKALQPTPKSGAAEFQCYKLGGFKLSIEWKEITGHISKVLPKLKVKLSLYQRRQQVKIGITDNPNRRWKKHSNSPTHNWKKMIVIYKSSVVSG